MNRLSEEEILRDLCENSHDLIQSVSPNGRFIYVNRSWLVTLGYTKSEVSDLNVFDVIHPDHRESCETMMQEVMTGRPVRDFETTLITKDGRRVLVQGNVNCRFDNQRPVATRGIFRDVTLRRAAEDELDRLFNLSLDLLCIAGTDGYFKRINPAFERVLGFKAQELLSRRFVEFIHPEDRESTLREVDNLAQGRVVVDFQNRYLASDDKYRWLAWRATPMPNSGLIYAIARDITEEKENQDLLERQTKELARSNADLEQFAYLASHDLHAPLRSVANLAQWIEQDLERDLPDKVRRHVATMRERVAKMQNLIDDLLLFARVGRGPRKLATVDCKQLVQQVAQILDPPDEFSISIATEMPVLETAETRLEQVFRNLIENSIRHHDQPQGAVTVSARDLGPAYEFTVADDGPGIADSDREKIFEMLRRLGPSSDSDGTGIGLALVKRIVESVGGSIWLEPRQGRGSTFRFVWPKQIRAVGEDEV